MPINLNEVDKSVIATQLRNSDWTMMLIYKEVAPNSGEPEDIAGNMTTKFFKAAGVTPDSEFFIGCLIEGLFSFIQQNMEVGFNGELSEVEQKTGAIAFVAAQLMGSVHTSAAMREAEILRAELREMKAKRKTQEGVFSSQHFRFMDPEHVVEILKEVSAEDEA